MGSRLAAGQMLPPDQGQDIPAAAFHLQECAGVQNEGHGVRSILFAGRRPLCRKVGL